MQSQTWILHGGKQKSSGWDWEVEGGSQQFQIHKMNGKFKMASAPRNFYIKTGQTLCGVVT